jgi:hypothetical protein
MTIDKKIQFWRGDWDSEKNYWSYSEIKETKQSIFKLWIAVLVLSGCWSFRFGSIFQGQKIPYINK